MTRKQAISQAIAILSQDAQNANIIEKLKAIQSELPITTWTQASIIDAVENYAIEHNNVLPYQKQLTSENNLPSFTAIRGQFGVSSVYDFYDIYLPNYKKFYRTNSPYKEQDILYFQNIFINNYNRIKQQLKVKTVRMKTYDDHRDSNTPLAKTIIVNCGCETYDELLIRCGFKKPRKDIEVSVHISYNNDSNNNTDFCNPIQNIIRSNE
ncbi:MAG: hypothetical protein NC489_28590 [Ruminococcus flavefaciens]|nr:hypothetical protein [Ruminococcus flavefaciens]